MAGLSFGFGSGSSKSQGMYADEGQSVTQGKTTPIIYGPAQGPLNSWLSTTQNVFSPTMQDPAGANPLLKGSYNAMNKQLTDYSYVAPYDAARQGLYRLNDEIAPQAQAASMTAAQTSGPGGISASTGASASDPYKGLYDTSVLTPTLNAFDYGTDRAMSALDARVAGAGAFGNERSGLAYSDLGTQRANERAKLVNDLQTQGLTTAFGFGQQDASRGLQAQQGNQQSELATKLANLNATQDAARFNAQNETANNQFNANQILSKMGINLNTLGQITNNQNSLNTTVGNIINNANTGGQQQFGNQVAASSAIGQPIQTAVGGLTGQDQYQDTYDFQTGWSKNKGNSSSFGLGVS